MEGCLATEEVTVKKQEHRAPIATVEILNLETQNISTTRMKELRGIVENLMEWAQEHADRKSGFADRSALKPLESFGPSRNERLLVVRSLMQMGTGAMPLAEGVSRKAMSLAERASRDLPEKEARKAVLEEVEEFTRRGRADLVLELKDTFTGTKTSTVTPEAVDSKAIDTLVGIISKLEKTEKTEAIAKAKIAHDFVVGFEMKSWDVVDAFHTIRKDMTIGHVVSVVATFDDLAASGKVMHFSELEKEVRDLLNSGLRGLAGERERMLNDGRTYEKDQAEWLVKSLNPELYHQAELREKFKHLSPKEKAEARRNAAS
jgi:hypothetical protein